MKFMSLSDKSISYILFFPIALMIPASITPSDTEQKKPSSFCIAQTGGSRVHVTTTQTDNGQLLTVNLPQADIKHLLECDKNTGCLRYCKECITVQNKELQPMVGQTLPAADMHHILPCKVTINSFAGSACSECSAFKSAACLAITLQARVGQNIQFLVQE